MSNLILNEGYEKNTDLFNGAQDDKIFKKRKNILICQCVQAQYY